MTLMASRPAKVVDYPESDGEPVADNTKQFRWIYVLFGNIAALFRNRLDVFVGGNLFWYPVEGEPGIQVAPDVFAVFGRPKGDRPSYKQWQEGDVPMTVVFEVLSPRNSYMEMVKKQAFYEDHGVEEYYVYDPDSNSLNVYLRRGELLLLHRPAHGFVSPRLGIRFDLSGQEMAVYGPDNQRFLTFEELKAQMEQAEKNAEVAEKNAQLSRQRLARLAELSRKARHNQAGAEELQELEELENEASSSS
jgi:Uma2 family endonuclease